MKINQSIIFKTVDDYRSILPRLIVGLVFFSEGIQKFLVPELVGAGKGTNRVWLSYPADGGVRPPAGVLTVP